MWQSVVISGRFVIPLNCHILAIYVNRSPLNGEISSLCIIRPTHALNSSRMMCLAPIKAPRPVKTGSHVSLDEKRRCSLEDVPLGDELRHLSSQSFQLVPIRAL